MAFRVGQEKGRTGWYVYVSKPSEYRKKKGSNTVRKKGGDTQQEAMRNALRIEAEVLRQWQLEAIKDDPFSKAAELSQSQGVDLDVALDGALREANYKHEEKERILNALYGQRAREQGGQELDTRVSREEAARLEELQSGTRNYKEWLAERGAVEQRAQSTARNWENKLRQLSQWYGSPVVGTMTRKDANAFKLHLAQKAIEPSYLKTYIGTLSGFWNWAITSGELEGENIWTGLKKGLPKDKKREAVDPELMKKAEAKADELGDIRFWFGRYQGLRKEDYCGLRWCDLDMQEGVMHIKRYEWEGKRRNLKLKEGGERSIPIHSELQKRIREMLPDALTRNDEEPIWSNDYKPSLENWGSTWAETHTYRYGFGSHDLRAYVVTQMMMQNINPYYLHAITGHTVPGSSKVVAGYVSPSLEQVREVLELLK